MSATDHTPSASSQAEIDTKALRQIRRSLKRAEKAALDAWLTMLGLPTKGEIARIWRRWLRNGITKALREFDKPTTQEVAAFVAGEIRADLRKAKRAVAGTPSEDTG